MMHTSVRGRVALVWLAAALALGPAGCSSGGGGSEQARGRKPVREAPGVTAPQHQQQTERLATGTAALAEPEPVAPLRLSTLRERALGSLEAAARDADAQVRSNAMEFALLAPRRMSAARASALSDPNPAVRTSALVTIGRAGLAEHVDRVAPLTADSSAFVRSAAIFAMAKLGRGADSDVSTLADILFNDPSPRVRAHVAFLLGELGQPGAAGMLRDAAAAPMSQATSAEAALLRLQIAEAMVKLGQEGELPAIRAALYAARPEDLEASALAVQILGQLRDRGSTDYLVWMTGQRDEQGNPLPAEVRLSIAAALAKIGMSRGDFIADEFIDHPSPAIRAQAADVYGHTGTPRNLAKLERMLEDPSPVVRVYAAAAILRTADRQTAR
jgi:HEAT repeat protein